MGIFTDKINIFWKELQFMLMRRKEFVRVGIRSELRIDVTRHRKQPITFSQSSIEMTSSQSDYAKSIFRPNITGTAYERHKKYVRDFVDVYGSSSQASSSVTRRTDFDVLKERHR